MMFQPDAEAMPVEQRAKLQEERLRGLVDRLLAAAGVQAERLRAAGVTSGADVGLADLARLPVTEKKDLWAAYPFGMLGVPRSEVVVFHGSSGTGGRPTLVGYTRHDLQVWAQVCARALAGAEPARAASCITPMATGCLPAGSVFTRGRSNWARPWCRCPAG